MTAELPWNPVGVAAGYRGNQRVATSSATAHGTSTANITVVATARAAVLSVADSVVSTMATYGSPWQLPRQFPRMSNRINFHGHPRPSAAIATVTLRYAAITTEVRRSPRQLPQHVPRFCPWQTLSLPTMPTEVRGNCHGNFRGKCRGTDVRMGKG